MNPLALSASRQLLKLKKHAPTIMFVSGVGATIASTVLASSATLKLESVLDEADKDISRAKNLLASPLANEKDENGFLKYTDEDYKKDIFVINVRTVRKIARLYAPAFIVGVAGIALLTRSHVILSRRNAGLAAAYAALDGSFRNYRNRVSEEIGAEKEEHIYRDVQKRDVLRKDKDGKDVAKKESVGSTDCSPYAKWFAEGNTSDWSPNMEQNLVMLRVTQNHWNDRLAVKGHVFLNEVYDSLGFDRTKEGSVVGWTYDGDGDGYISFGIFEEAKGEAMFRYVRGDYDELLLDFNVDGVIYDKI
jgi:hypothetical protein